MNSVKHITFIYPAKMRLACNGDENAGFLIRKTKNFYKNSEGKYYFYEVGVVIFINGLKSTHSSIITKDTYSALLNQAKFNFKKFKQVVKPGEQMTIKIE